MDTRMNSAPSLINTRHPAISALECTEQYDANDYEEEAKIYTDSRPSVVLGIKKCSRSLEEDMFGSPYSACGPADGFGQKEKPDTLLSKLCMMSSSDLSDHGEDSDAEEAMQLSSLLCDETGYEGIWEKITPSVNSTHNNLAARAAEKSVNPSSKKAIHRVASLNQWITNTDRSSADGSPRVPQLVSQVELQKPDSIICKSGRTMKATTEGDSEASDVEETLSMRHSLAHRCDSLVGHVYKVCRQKLDSSASFRPIRSGVQVKPSQSHQPGEEEAKDGASKQRKLSKKGSFSFR